MLSIDFGFLIMASSSLFMWFRLREGRLASVFRILFFASFIGLLISIFVHYQGLPGLNWLMASGNAFLLALISIAIRMMRSMKIAIIPSLVIIAALLVGGRYVISNSESYGGQVCPYDHDAEYIVKLNEGADPGAFTIGTLTPLISAQSRPKDDWDQYYALNVPYESTQKIESFINTVREHEDVAFVEFNEIMKLTPTLDETLRRAPDKLFANDPDVNKQWQYDIMQYDQLHIFLNEYQGRRYQSKLVILDSGVDAAHEDLKNVYTSIEKDSDKDSNGHGTHCASVARSTTSNNKGIASLDSDNQYVNVSSIKVMNVFGIGTQDKILKGIVKAIDNGADVINMSLGGMSNDDRQRAYQEAIDYAHEKKTIVVVAAGNNGGDSKNITPANINGVICVSAVGDDLKMPSFANKINNIGQAVLAPGVSIHAAMPGNKYASLSGTSMAAPHVSGLAAIAKSIDPELTHDAFYALLEETGLPITGGTLIQPYLVIKKLTEQTQ